MSRGDLPDRLLSGEATAFERRLIDAALENRPPAAASARVARALGVSVTTIGTAAAAKALAAEAAATKATAAAGMATLWPWISATVVGLAVAGSVVAVRAHRATPAAPAPVSAPLREPATPAIAPSEPARPVAVSPVERPSGPAASRRRTRPASIDGDLREQIALIDAARLALSSGSPRRALETLRRYRDRYPAGSFDPEVTASTVEALVKLGREPEARALATRFVAEHRGTLLAKRVAELVGLREEPQPQPNRR